MGDGGGREACASLCSPRASLLCNRRRVREARGEMRVGSGDREAEEEEEEEEPEEDEEDEDEKEQEEWGGDTKSRCSSSSLTMDALRSL